MQWQRSCATANVSYPSSAGEPPKQLRGFEKVSVDVGQSTVVEFDLLRKDLSYWDVVSQNWVIELGEYGFFWGVVRGMLKFRGVLQCNLSGLVPPNYIHT